MRIAIFVDGSNLFYTQRSLGWRVDLHKFIEYFNQVGQVVDAYYYSGLRFPLSENKQKFLDNLPALGYVAITKAGKMQASGFKANLDIEIVLDMFNTIDTYDAAVLVSGDGDFERALNLLRARGKRFYVVSTARSVAKELLAICGMHYIDLLDIKDYVCRKEDALHIEWPQQLSAQEAYWPDAPNGSYLDDFPPEAENI